MEAALKLPPISSFASEELSAAALKQATHELHRAQDFGTDADLATWAKRWGQSLVQTVQDASAGTEALRDARTALEVASTALEKPVTRLEALVDAPVRSAPWLHLGDDVTALRECIDAIDGALENQ